MQAVGMIAEFNPLHRGHVFALEQARRLAHADVVIVVMSGNYVQRGEPALLDKWTRAKLALLNGADLVIELPVTDVIQAAPEFATGGVALLNALGVNSLAFGSEAPKLDYLALAKKMTTAPPASDQFDDFTQTYATQLNQYYRQSTGVDLSAPNLLLGMSYAQADVVAGAPLRLLPFARQGAAHDAPASGRGASASAIRQAVAAHQLVDEYVPASTAQALSAGPHFSWTQFYPWLAYRLQTADLAELRQVAGMSEGLEHRLTQQMTGQADFATFLHAIKSKRYTYARLRRLCLATVLNLTQSAVDSSQRQRYVHVLGFTQAGQAYLHAIKKNLGLPLITKVSRDMLAPGGMMAMQGRADRLIETLSGPAEQNFGRPPLMVNSKEDS